MRKYIFIAGGGILGAMARFASKNVFSWNGQEGIPYATLFVNSTGCFLLGLVLTVAFEVWAFDADVRHGIAAGFLGAYTTFSTLCKESVILLQNRAYLLAILYVSISTVLGLAAVYSGMILARGTISGLIKNKQQAFAAEAVQKKEGEEGKGEE